MWKPAFQMSSSNRLQRRRSPPPSGERTTDTQAPSSPALEDRSPATHAAPISTTSIVSTQSGVYPPRAPLPRSPTEQDEPRALKRQTTAGSIVSPVEPAAPRPGEQYRQQSHYVHQSQQIQHGQQSHAYRTSGHFPPQSLPSQSFAPQSFPPHANRAPEGSYTQAHESLAYGQDHRSKPPKEKSSALKKFGQALFHETIQQSRPVGTMETDMDRYHRERKDLRLQNQSLTEQNEHNARVIRQLHSDLLKEKERAERSARSASLLETTLENKDVFLGAQARNDDEVRGKFGGLLSAIKTWSNNFNAGTANAFREEQLGEYQCVAPLCKKLKYLESLVEDKKRKRLFVRGWAAFVMTKLLFRTLDEGEAGREGKGTDVWIHGGLAEPFSELEDEFWNADRKVISHRAFNDWRAFTADLLGKTSTTHAQATKEEVRKAVLNAVHEVMAVVRPWCVSSDQDSSYADRLQKIFQEAVQLAQFLRCQRALWSVRFPTRPRLPGLENEWGHLMFDPASMKDDRGEDEDVNPQKLKQQYIDVVVSPALYKRGNTNGERFENEEAVLPAVVVMRLA